MSETISEIVNEITNPFDPIYNQMVTTNTRRAFEEPLEFPKEIHIELTNRCNLRCPFCPIGQRTIKRPYGNMREDLFWGICTEALEYKAALRLIRWGEPTLHVRCYDYIKMAKNVGLLVHMNTNGVGLDAVSVLESELDSIKISLHNLDAVKAVKRLIALRDSWGLSKPYITVAELSSERAYRERKGITKYRDSLKPDKWIVANVKPLNKGGRCPKTCWELYNRLSVDWDGTVVACCGAYDRQMKLGHIYDNDTLKEIWDGNILNRYREMEQRGALGQVPLCSNCAR